MITKFKLYEKKDENWKLILDISTIWKDDLYENVNELTAFNQNYINFLNEQKSLITQKTSQEEWNKLHELILRLENNKDKITESTSVWEDIYDWADGNMVEIKVEAEAKQELKADF
jgi:NAD-dependent SIR2 family protein deacetylase